MGAYIEFDKSIYIAAIAMLAVWSCLVCKILENPPSVIRVYLAVFTTHAGDFLAAEFV